MREAGALTQEQYVAVSNRVRELWMRPIIKRVVKENQGVLKLLEEYGD